MYQHHLVHIQFVIKRTEARYKPKRHVMVVAQYPHIESGFPKIRTV